MKSGFRTTEFWLTFLACAVGLFLSSGLVVEASVAFQIASVVASALVALGYTVPRINLKKEEMNLVPIKEESSFTPSFTTGQIIQAIDHEGNITTYRVTDEGLEEVEDEDIH